MNAGTYNAYKNFLTALADDDDYTKDDFKRILEAVDRAMGLHLYAEVTRA